MMGSSVLWAIKRMCIINSIFPKSQRQRHSLYEILLYLPSVTLDGNTLNLAFLPSLDLCWSKDNLVLHPEIMFIFIYLLNLYPAFLPNQGNSRRLTEQNHHGCQDTTILWPEYNHVLEAASLMYRALLNTCYSPMCNTSTIIWNSIFL